MNRAVSVDLLTVGEVMRALVAADGQTLDRAGSFHATIAGAESNVAIGLTRLGFRAALVGRVGADAAGRFVQRMLRAEGIDTGQVQPVTGASTGLLLRDSSPANLITVNYFRAGSAGSSVDADQVRRAWDDTRPQWVHVTGITAMLSDASRAALAALLGLAARAAVPVSFDVNLRTTLAPAERWRRPVRELAEHADVVFATTSELALLGPQAIDRLVAAGSTVVHKRENLTVALHSADGSEMAEPLPAAVVDPVGAGDALAAGYLSGRLRGDDPATSLRRGVACAAFAVEHWSDVGGLPDEAALARRLSAADSDPVSR